jgi:membrane peptidoglycan carboxypeptidase
VYPVELVAAYSAFATLGERAVPQAIIRVESSKGEVLWQPEITRVPVMSPEESWLMVSAMKDVVRKGTAAGSVGALFSKPAGGKTGTTNDGTDVWFIGYTSDLVAGVWMGFDKPQKIQAGAQGGRLAAPAWTAFMNEVYSRKPSPPDWPMPMNIVTRQIDFSTNMLATPYCPASLVGNEFFIPGTDPMFPCDVHTQFGIAPDTGLGATYQPRPIDTTMTGGVPKNLPVPQPTRDSAQRLRDSMIWVIPKRDTTRTINRSLSPLDSARRARPDTTLRRPRPDTIPVKPDTGKVRPDTGRARVDAIRCCRR